MLLHDYCCLQINKWLIPASSSSSSWSGGWCGCGVVVDAIHLQWRHSPRPQSQPGRRAILHHIGSGSSAARSHYTYRRRRSGRYAAANHAPLTGWAGPVDRRSIRIRGEARRRTDRGQSARPPRPVRDGCCVRWRWRLIARPASDSATLHHRLVR